MKTLLLFLLLPLGFFAQDITDPAVYNDKIVAYQNDIGYKMVAMNDYIASEGATLAETDALRLEVLKAVKESITGVTKMKSFEGNDDLRKSALALFQFYDRVVTYDYKEAIDILFMENLTDEKMARLEEIVEKITNEEKEFDDKFEKVQVAFAEKHNIDLEENELQEQIDAE